MNQILYAQINSSINVFANGVGQMEGSHTINGVIGQSATGISGNIKAGYIYILGTLIPTNIEDKLMDGMPSNFHLYNNYPNPFNPSTTVEYDVKSTTNVKLQIYNVLGQIVHVAVDRVQNAGRYKAIINMTEIPSGVYVYRINMGDYTNTKKMVLLR